MKMKGFTLIELLIVISIIGILAVALLPSILDAPQSARDAGRKAALNNVIVAIEQYRSATGNLPSDEAACLEPGDTTDQALYNNLSQFFKDDDVPDYTENIADDDAVVVDDTNCKSFVYVPLAGDRYFAGVVLETFGTGDGIYDLPSAGDKADEVGTAGDSYNLYGILQ